MMNAARFSVGVQGYRRWRTARTKARSSTPRSASKWRDVQPRARRRPLAIIQHPDVRRMLMWQKATIEAMRALAYVTAASLDFANKPSR